MSTAEESLKTAKIQRRTAKATLTRLGKALVVLQEQKRPVDEVSNYLVKINSGMPLIMLS
jgi:hypothetical protein